MRLDSLSLRSVRSSKVGVEVLQSGKHRGKRFSIVAKQDVNYCNWVSAAALAAIPAAHTNAQYVARGTVRAAAWNASVL